MVNLESLLVKIVGDASGLDAVIGKTDGMLANVGKGMQSAGGWMTAAVTLPIIGVGIAAMNASGELNSMMGNVQSLGVGTDRVVELKSSVQDLAVEMGKGTDDMADGLYQVISAFGDTTATVDILENAARTGAAGLATTTDALNLLATVTKGYGDESLEAQKKVSDLAFQTVNLGQTTFPELAASMGKVVPLAAALGVSQEELFAQMATLTGVTGTAAEVTTQLRATYSGILSPTKEMSRAISEVAGDLDRQGKLVGGELVDRWRDAQASFHESAISLGSMRQRLEEMTTSGTASKEQVALLTRQYKDQKTAVDDAEKAMESAAAALGQSIVKSVGLNDAVSMLSGTAEGNTDVLSKMFGSVEALNAVLALSGGQAESFEKKLAAMGDASGATDAAFEAQTQGIGKAGFTMQQVWAKVEVLTQKLGDGLAPTIMKLIDNPITPLIDKLLSMADTFVNSDEETQSWILTIVAIAAAAGPVLVVIGSLISTVSAVIGVFSAASGVIGAAGGVIALLGGPITLIVAAIGGLAYAWYNNWGGIRDFTDSIFGEIDISFAGLKDGMSNTWAGIKSLTQLGWDDYKNIASASMSAVENSLGLSQGTIAATFTSMWTSIKDAAMSVDWLGLGTAMIEAIIKGITSTGLALAQAAQDVAGGFWDSLKSLVGLDSGTSLGMQAVGGGGGYGGGGSGGSTYNINVSVYVNGTGTLTTDVNSSARSGVLEALRAVGLG